MWKANQCMFVYREHQLDLCICTMHCYHSGREPIAMGFLSDRFSVTIVSQAINGSSAGNVLTHRLRVMCLCQHYHSFDMSRWGENPETLKYLFWQIIYQVIVCCRNLKRWRMVRVRLRVVRVGNLPTSMATKLKQGNKTNYQGNKNRARQQNQLARD